MEDLQGVIAEDDTSMKNDLPTLPSSHDEDESLLRSINKPGPCSRPGGCCRDDPKASSCGSAPTAGIKTSEPLEFSIPDSQLDSTLKSSPVSSEAVPKEIFKPYEPSTEPLFPPSLRRYEVQPVCYGDERKLWFKPTTLQQLIELKSAYPSAKIVGGASETQIEVRFKKMNYQVSIFVADIVEINTHPMSIQDNLTLAELNSLSELCIPGNLSLTKLEYLCRDLYQKLGRRASVLEALRKQLRYFAGRQIRNVASLAGSLATASPISDSAPLLLAAGATVTIQSQSRGIFDIPITSWFLRYRTTALPDDGVITQIVIPLPTDESREITKAYKQAKRKDDDIAIVTAGFRVRLDENGLVEDCGFSLGGMAPTTVVAVKAQEAVIGKKWSETTTLEAAINALLEQFDLSYGVPGGMAQYRRGKFLE